MTLFVNEKGEIKDVNTTNRSGLTSLVVSDNDNPFKDWSVAKICCYKVDVREKQVVMFTPYVDSRIIEHIDALGKQSETNSIGIEDTQNAVCEESTDTNNRIRELENAICELSETL